MKRHLLFFSSIATLLLATTAPSVATTLAEVVVDGSSVTWYPQVPAETFLLRVSGPGGRIEKELSSLPTIEVVGPDGERLADGTYTYELWLLPFDETNGEPKGGSLQWGYLTIDNGQFLSPALQESAQDPGDKVFYNENLYVKGQACIGQDCNNNQNLDSTLVLEEDDLGIEFTDTSTSSGVPSNDWKLSINDGNANKISIVDVSNGKTPMTLVADAPDHSLYVDSAGDVGLGTISPETQLHLISSSVPAIRLEYSSSGTVLSKWDLTADDTELVISDRTGSLLEPFRIAAGAPSDALVVDSAGEVGLGTDSPATDLHIIGSVKIDTVDDGGAPIAEMLELESNGDNKARIRFDDGTGDQWNAGAGTADTFVIFDPSDAAELILTDSGNLTISGTLTEGSDIASKENFSPIDPAQILALATHLPLMTWNYKEDSSSRLHLGPTAQDFHAAFGLGGETGIAPRDFAAVSLAALQGLHHLVETRNQELQQDNERLKRQNEDLGARLQALEARVALLVD